MAGYPLPPREPAGGWKNMAQWIGNVEYWSEQMAKMGYTLQDFMDIYTRHTGDPYPKNLKNSFEAKKALFPGADMLNEYDMDNHMKRRFPHHSLEGDKGYGEWVPMSESEVRAANQYHSWQNNPANEWQILGSGDNAYIAWLANWGEKFKMSGWEPEGPGGQMPTTDIHSGADLNAWTPGRTMGMNVPPKSGTPPPNTTPGSPIPGAPTIPGAPPPTISGSSSASWLRGTGAVTPGTPPSTGFAASTTGGWTPQGTYSPQRNPRRRTASSGTNWWNYGQY